MYLIWRMDTTAKGAKKNTSPNVIHLQCVHCCFQINLDPLGVHARMGPQEPLLVVRSDFMEWSFE